MPTEEQVKALQRTIFIAVLGVIGIIAIRPGKEEIVGALLLGAAIAYAIIRTLHDHHKKGAHRRAAIGFAKTLGVLGLLLLVVGIATLATGGTPMAALDIAAGAGLFVYGLKRYLNLRG